MSSFYEKFTGLYPVSKTLRFSLIPQYETADNLQKAGIVANDNGKAEAYKSVKKLMDRVHRYFIDSVLEKLDYDWESLAKAYEAASSSDSNAVKEFENEKSKAKKYISKCLKEDSKDKLNPKSIIDAACKAVKDKTAYFDFTAEELKELASFNGFATYFEGYRTVRDNLYKDNITGCVAHRIVEENFIRFMQNRFIYLKTDKAAFGDFDAAELEGLCSSLDDVFEAGTFGKLLGQKGTDLYNKILGGYSESETVKKQGLNELLNLAHQQNLIDKKAHFSPLYKQILSEGEGTFSFVREAIENDAVLLEVLSEFAEKTDALLKQSSIDAVFNSADTVSSGIIVNTADVTFLAQIALGDWSAFSKFKDEKKKVITLDRLQSLTDTDILGAVCARLQNHISQIDAAYNALKPLLMSERVNEFNTIKTYLDEVLNLQRVLGIFDPAKAASELDSGFYAGFMPLYTALQEVIPLYNKVRSYATKKPFSTEKFKLNFENAQLGNGWDVNKESDHACTIMRKEGMYYLGVWNKKAKNKKLKAEDSSAFEKMFYKYVPDTAKMLPKVFFSKDYKKSHDVPEYIEKGYDEKRDQYDPAFRTELIDFYKNGIAGHEDWSKFPLILKDSGEYESRKEFYNDLDTQMYMVSLKGISEEDLRERVKQGDLYLFQIYSKDFAAGSNGKENLHTMYWKQLFCESNLEKPVFKLCGFAELFFRPLSIENPFVHAQGSVLINKRTSDGKPVETETYMQAMKDAAAGMDISGLCAKYPGLVIKKATHEIIKDRRYTRDSYEFHVPMQINYGLLSQVSAKELNAMFIDSVTADESVNVIGIDRGERNLLYLCCVDRQGRILEQRSLNVIDGVDYQAKLVMLEKERDSARKNWKSIERIADMKEGYLSQAIHVITEMMFKYNAVIALEDLNFGFKRGRFRVERQVYQKFEKMLITKLNYLVFKDAEPGADGSVSKGYQLTAPFESFEKLGKQTGAIWYIPAANTSRIDPATGFVNLFTSEELSYKSIEQTRKFIGTFKEISYDSAADAFRFAFRYSDFKLNRKDSHNEWCITTKGEGRIVYANGQHETVDVTARFKQLFMAYNIDYSCGDLREKICAVKDSQFCRTVLWMLGTVLKLRYESETEDFILSPVEKNGRCFDSRRALPGEPVDGDANGAYHIALQGLRLITERCENGKVKPDEKGKQLENWLRFACRIADSK